MRVDKKFTSAGANDARTSIGSPPVMETLKVDVQDGEKFREVTPNSRVPSPFDTDIFGGISQIVVRTAPIDQHYSNFFEGRKRLFEVQVQGKFKRMPVGEMYVGAEISEKMELGLITRSISLAALKLCSTMANDLHSSLGETKKGKLHQRPHAVAPLFTTFDKVIVTPAGETPPPLGVPFTEDLEYRKLRLKYRYINDANLDLTSTYSFSVNTSNLNLINWTLVGIPMVRPMDLRTFIASGSIRLVGYEIPADTVAKHGSDHVVGEINYVFNMQLHHREPEEEEAEVDLPIALSELVMSDGEDEGENELEGEGDGEGSGIEDIPKRESLHLAHPEIRSDADDDSDSSSSDGSYKLATTVRGMAAAGANVKGANQGTKTPPPPKRRRSASKSKGMSGWIRKHITHNNANVEVQDIEVADVYESGEFTSTDYQMESTGDLAFCPAAMEMIYEGRRRVLYFLPLTPAQQEVALRVDPDDLDPLTPRLRPFSEIARVLPLLPIPRMHKNRRLSSLEKRRRQIVESARVLGANPTDPHHAKYVTFLNQVTSADLEFLDGNSSVLHLSRPKGDTEVHSWSGCVAMATSRRHWIEFYLVLTQKEACFYRKQHSSRNSTRAGRRPALRLQMSAVVSMQPMNFHDIPLHGFSFFQIETFPRVYYIMVRGDIQLNEWIEAFVACRGKEVLASPFDDTFYQTTEVFPVLPARFAEPRGDAYLAKSACWKLDKKRIFNYRRIIFNPATIRTRYSTLTPNEFVQQVLANVLELSSASPEFSRRNAFQWVKFLDEIAWLQTINVSALGECEKIAFFLNLYHIMVLHGSLVVGPPPAWNYWNAFFNNITYLFSYEIVSISDVEHNILRAAMARPSSLSIIPVPQHQFPGFAVTERDFRLSFCVNSGSKTMPSMVPVYTPDNLDDLMDEITAVTLLVSAEIDLSKRNIVLPKLLLQDFVKKNSTGAPLDCLRALLSYLPRECRAQLRKALSDGVQLNVRFKNHSLRCRRLRAYTPLSGEMAKETEQEREGQEADTGEWDQD